jgi:hypothetical protein
MTDHLLTGASTAAGRYKKLSSDREPFLQRARRQASLTLTSLFRNIGDNGFTDHAVAWNSFGAYAVNNLSNKVILSLFPAGVPWIKLRQSRQGLADLAELPPEIAGQLRAEIAAALSIVEQDFTEEVEVDGDRFRLFTAVKRLLVGGNHALRFLKNGKVAGIPLERYVTLRAPDGTLVEWVIESAIDFEHLPEDVQRVAQEKGHKGRSQFKPADIIKVYTHGYFNDGQWIVYDEVEGEKVADSEAKFDPDTLPWMFLRWTGLEEEHYGRSYAEDYEADLQTVDGITQIVQEGSAAAALFIRLVSPNGVTNKRAIEQAQNGAVITGEQQDVSTLQGDKGSDFQGALTVEDRALARLSRAFLLNSAVQRSGERVTAEEIRFVARELEDQLGGAYSNQVVEFQQPYARLKLQALQRLDRITRMPKNAVDLVIITGSAALGRQAEIQLLDAFLLGGAQVIQAIGPNIIDENVYMKRRAAALGVDTEGLVLTPEQRDARQQELAQSQLSQQIAPEVTRQAGQLIQQQRQQAADQAQTQDQQ